MASNINPNNIDGAYPVAGQDNNSQGFRDNFTNTKVNFQYAAEEITALQTNGVFTNTENNMNDNLILAAKLQDTSYTRVPLSATSGSVNINYASGQFQTITPSAGNISLSFSDWPATGSWGWVRLQITVTNAAYTVELPVAVNIGTSGIQGYNSSTRTITFAATGVYTFEFSTTDNGGHITIQDITRPLNVYSNPLFLASSNDVAPATAISLATSASYFSTVAAETATLATGTDGQIKSLMAVDVSAGNMVVTVSNAGWKASGTGTITFSSIGAACTLQYINNKWFCIGNNGAVFA